MEGRFLFPVAFLSMCFMETSPDQILDMFATSGYNFFQIMRKLLHLKLFAMILLVIMLTVMINGSHACAHDMDCQMSAASDHGSPSVISASHHCPCCPVEQHNDCDDCDTCINCTCHAPLTIQAFQLDYNPNIRELSTSEPFKHLPEVYLSKFIPPHILV
jgi:hypothetical protein